MRQVPLFYCRTTIVCVCSDKLLLNSLKKIIEKTHDIIFLKDSKEALNLLKTYKSQLTTLPELNYYADDSYHNTDGDLVIKFDFITLANKILKIAGSGNELSILMVDFANSDVDGVELLYQLVNVPAKKVVFSGDITPEQVTSAFNDQYLNYYLTKDGKNLFLDVRSQLLKLTEEFFIDCGAYLCKFLEADGTILPVSDEKFIKLFRNFIAQHNIVEYTIIDKNGSYYLSNTDGESFYIIVHTDKSLDKFIWPYDDDEDLAPLIKQINDRKKIPFFIGDNANPDKVDYKDWPNYLLEPKVLDGSRVRFFYAIITAK